MPFILRDTIAPSGDFPAVEAKDVQMPDGSRLSDFSGGGSGDVLVVTVDTHGGFIASHSPSQIKQAAEKGTVVMLKDVSSANHETYHLHYVSDDNVAYFYKVEIPYAGINYISWIGYQITEDKQANPFGYSGIYYTLPDPSGVVDGKILQVVGGKAAWVSVADSAVKTYIDDYISSALEGDY